MKVNLTHKVTRTMEIGDSLKELKATSIELNKHDLLTLLKSDNDEVINNLIKMRDCLVKDNN